MSAAKIVIWNGTTDEKSLLVDALNHNCPGGTQCTPSSRCSAHSLLLDQSTVDHLICMRRSCANNWITEDPQKKVSR